MSSGLSVVTFAFTGTTPKHRCAIPQCETVENATYQFNFTKVSSEEMDDFVISKDLEKQIYKSCQRINMKITTSTCYDYSNAINRD